MPDAMLPYIAAAFRDGGLTLDQYYVHRMCAPSRRSFLSGRFPHKAGVTATHYE